jgi:DNA-binding MarR family transcriptional regulator
MKYVCANVACGASGDTYNGVAKKYCSHACGVAAVTRVTREALERLLSRGLHRAEIARQLHVDRSAVTRAVKRYGLTQ